MNYLKLDVWLEARKLTNLIYKISGAFPRQEMYGLTNQMRRCAVSIPSNIAEGCGRRTAKDTISFLHVARGSLYELETQVYIALDQQYIDDQLFQAVSENIESTKKLLNGFINYYRKLE